MGFNSAFKGLSASHQYAYSTAELQMVTIRADDSGTSVWSASRTKYFLGNSSNLATNLIRFFPQNMSVCSLPVHNLNVLLEGIFAFRTRSSGNIPLNLQYFIRIGISSFASHRHTPCLSGIRTATADWFQLQTQLFKANGCRRLAELSRSIR